ncbi:hypothetical protein D3C73_1346620 [compost metagenome]
MSMAPRVIISSTGRARANIIATLPWVWRRKRAVSRFSPAAARARVNRSIVSPTPAALARTLGSAVVPSMTRVR